MNYPELLLFPVFGLADYFLTLAGAVLREKKFGNHFKKEHYELNPVWQSAIAEKKWFNPKLLLLTLIEIIVIIFVIAFGDIPEAIYQTLLGFYFVGYGILIGNHLRNILTYWHVNRKPDEITGQVFMTHGLSLSMSLYELIIVLIPLTTISLFAPSPFVMGATINCALQILAHVIWIWNDRRNQGNHHVLV